MTFRARLRLLSAAAGRGRARALLRRGEVLFGCRRVGGTTLTLGQLLDGDSELGRGERRRLLLVLLLLLPRTLLRAFPLADDLPHCLPLLCSHSAPFLPRTPAT